MNKEESSTRSQTLRKTGVVALSVFLTAAMGVGLGMAVFPTRIAVASSVNGLDLSLKSHSEAEKALQEWWFARADEELSILGPDPTAEPVVITIQELGVQLDIKRTLAQLPLDSFEDWTKRTTQRANPAPINVRPIYDFTFVDEDLLKSIVAQTSPPLAPAKVLLDENGEILHTPEVTNMSLVLGVSQDSLVDGLDFGETCTLSAVYDDKAVSDSLLYGIKDVVSSYSTTFSKYQKSRSENLRVASEKLDGVILMPGEIFSFNDFVGQRTRENGFKLAGVYRRGRHDVDYGGGVCQVSTTLFNAAILANLEIEKRGNHTFTVPYVPLGRDAAVSYGELDMKFVNTMETPIAISSKWELGKLSFTILGTKQEGLEVKVTQWVTERWEHETLYVEDTELELNTEKEIEKGGKGYKAITKRIVLIDGVEVSNETLCRSHYPGGPKIVAQNKGEIAEPSLFDPIPPIGF